MKRVVTFNADGVVMVNATEMARFFNKLPKDWIKVQYSQDFISVYSKRRKVLLADLVKVTKGGDNSGTWMHEEVAIEFARWLRVNI